MKKSSILLAVVVFIAVVWIGITFVVANQAETYYHRYLEESSQFGFVTFSNKVYDKGLLSSRVETLMEVKFPGIKMPDEQESSEESKPVPDVTEQTIQLVFESLIHHGPLPMTSGPAKRLDNGFAVALVETRLKHFSPSQAGLENLLESIPELRNSIEIARIDFDGNADSLLEIPAFDYSFDEGMLSFGGLDASVTYSLLSGAIAGNYDLKSVEFHLPEGGSISWNGFSGDFDLEKILPMFYVGPSKAVIGGMKMAFPSRKTGVTEQVTMEQMEVASVSRYDGKMVHIEQTTSFDGLWVNGDKYGPLLVDVEMKNFDAQVLSGFYQQIMSIYKDSSTLDPDALAGRILPLYLDLFSKLLAGNPEMNLRNFSLVTPRGNADGHFFLKFSGIDEVSFDDPLMLLQYVQNIEASAALSLDEGLMRFLMMEKARSGINEQIAVAKLLEQGQDLSDEQIEEMALKQYHQQLNMLIEQQFVMREENKIKSSMTFKNGELTVNGKALPIFRGGLQNQ